MTLSTRIDHPDFRTMRSRVPIPAMHNGLKGTTEQKACGGNRCPDSMLPAARNVLPGHKAGIGRRGSAKANTIIDQI